MVLCVVASACSAQRLTVHEFTRIAQVCVPEANPVDLIAIARTESNLNPWAISVNRPVALAHRFGYSSGRIDLHHQPTTKDEALGWVQELSASRVSVSVGLLQVNAEHAGHSTEELLDPCTNLRLGWEIFAAAYRQQVRLLGPGQRALLAAFGAYNAGWPATAFKNGYVSSVLRNRYQEPTK